MRELSLHILDIVQNSIAAAASLISICVNEDPVKDQLLIKITDDGSGIPKKDLRRVQDPFFTSRKTRAVGLGLSLMAQAAKRAEGELIVNSVVGKGTEVIVSFRYTHIDRAPLGDMQGTLLTSLVLNPEIDFVYHHVCGDREFVFDTRDVKEELDGIAINHEQVVSWIQGFLNEGLEELRGGSVDEIIS